MGREDHDGDVRVDPADTLQDFDAVELRHHQVEDDDVVASLANFVFDQRRIADGFDDEAIFFQHRLHQLADGSVVVDDEYAHRGYFDRHFRLLGPAVCNPPAILVSRE